MKQILTLLWATLLVACGGRYGAGIPAAYEPLLDEALADCPRADSLRELLRTTPRAEREAMAYTIAYMPRGDRDTLSIELLRENVAYACRARNEFAWAKTLPDSIFLNEVVPYASVDEVRDCWRPKFYEIFAPMIADCPDMRSAAELINQRIRETVKVDYNTNREKTNQNASESMRQGRATCTGLSVLLIDALRAVGIPARFAGTPAWHDNRGNHSWTEIWIDGKWYFTEYYYAGLDDGWFYADAGKATPGHQHGIFAVSFRPTGDWFPMVWNWHSREIHAVDVTPRYVDGYAALCAAQGDALVTVRFEMYRNAQHTSASTDRVVANVDVFCDGKQVGGGSTAGPLQDMNDCLTFQLEGGHTYAFRYENAKGEPVEIEAAVGDETVTVRGFME